MIAWLPEVTEPALFCEGRLSHYSWLLTDDVGVSNWAFAVLLAEGSHYDYLFSLLLEVEIKTKRFVRTTLQYKLNIIKSQHFAMGKVLFFYFRQ